jgi:hypothetical protein
MAAIIRQRGNVFRARLQALTTSGLLSFGDILFS